MNNLPRRSAIPRLAATVAVLAGSLSLRAADHDKLPLKLKLTKGESHQVDVHFKVELIGEDGKSKILKNLEEGVKLTVVDVDDQGSASIEAKVNRLVTTYPGERIDFDSTAPKGSKRNNSLYANAMLENPLTYTVSRLGLLSQTVKGQEPIRRAFKAANEAYAQSRDRDSQESFFPSSLNPLNAFLWGAAFVKFSAAPVGVGDTWTFTPPVDEKQKLRDLTIGAIKYTVRSRKRTWLS